MNPLTSSATTRPSVLPQSAVRVLPIGSVRASSENSAPSPVGTSIRPVATESNASSSSSVTNLKPRPKGRDIFYDLMHRNINIKEARILNQERKEAKAAEKAAEIENKRRVAEEHARIQNNATRFIFDVSMHIRTRSSDDVLKLRIQELNRIFELQLETVELEPKSTGIYRTAEYNYKNFEQTRMDFRKTVKFILTNSSTLSKIQTAVILYKLSQC